MFKLKTRKLLKIFLIFVLTSSWLLAGWPQILNFPPEIQVALAYDYDVTYSFTTQAIANNGSWTYWNTDIGNHSVAVRDTDQYWCWTNTGSPSSGTGPPTGVACIYPETSSPTAVGDVYTATLTTGLNANQYGFFVTFNRCMYGNTAGYMYFEAWNGTQWNTIASWPGNTTTTFVASGPYDFTTYTNTDFKIRFRVVVGGTAYQNDFTFDEVHIYGNAANQVTIADSTLSQPTNVTEGDTAVVMGAFTFIAGTSTATVTSITINEEGTVNANTNLTNVKLYSQQEATCTFAGSTQLGTTQSFNASDEATFSSLSLSVGTTTQQCVFVVLDVGSSAGGGNTIEIEITASGNVSITGGSPYAASWPVQISGTTTIRADQGTVCSTAITFSDFPGSPTAWNELFWTETEGTGESVTMQIASNSNCSTLIPDAAFSGCDFSNQPEANNTNSEGFAVNPVDISCLDEGTYGVIYLKSTLVASSTNSPTLDDWGVSVPESSLLLFGSTPFLLGLIHQFRRKRKWL